MTKTPLLDKVKIPADLKQFSLPEIKQISDEDRNLLKIYIMCVMQILEKANINYITDNDHYVEMRLRNNGWNGLTYIDGKYTKHLNKCVVPQSLDHIHQVTNRTREA
jgi:hypothetical protein